MEIKSIASFQIFDEDKFTKRVVYQTDESIVFILNFMPGQSLPKHKHPNSQVYILILQGAGTLTTDGVDTAVKTNDVVHCGGDEEFSFINTGDGNVSLFVQLTKIPG